MNKTRIVFLFIFVIISIVSLYYGGVFRPSDQQNKASKWTPKTVPNLEFTRLNGEKARLTDYKGRVILLNFWASWCAPCIKEFPSMVTLVKQNQGKVVLVAISLDDSMADIQKFIRKHSGQTLSQNDPDVIIAWDQTQSIARESFSVIKLPETIIIDKNSKMVSKIVGAVDWVGPEITDQIQTLISQ